MSNREDVTHERSSPSVLELIWRREEKEKSQFQISIRSRRIPWEGERERLTKSSSGDNDEISSFDVLDLSSDGGLAC